MGMAETMSRPWVQAQGGQSRASSGAALGPWTSDKAQNILHWHGALEAPNQRLSPARSIPGQSLRREVLLDPTVGPLRCISLSLVDGNWHSAIRELSVRTPGPLTHSSLEVKLSSVSPCPGLKEDAEINSLVSPLAVVAEHSLCSALGATSSPAL